MAKKNKNMPEIALAVEKAKGLVVKNTGSAYIVRLYGDGNEIPCRVKGNFRIKGLRTTNPVAVGDRVEVTLTGFDADYISAVEPRRNYIIRRASNLSKESHILAANIDCAMLVATLIDPMVTTTFIDRFLATAEAYNVQAELVLNKSDLWDGDLKELADGMKYLYETIGYPVMFASTVTGEGIESIRERCAGKVTLLAGNSGVGKSSLINTLVPGANLKTAKISDLHRTGQHTTTFSEMIPLPGGGELIDVPGVKGFGTLDFAVSEVSHFFPEIFRAGARCRYSDCRHTGEPGCAVAEELAKHLISQSRYASYLSVLDEAEGVDGAEKYRKPF